jgi:thiamine-phosphate pyrophosphorylase
MHNSYPKQYYFINKFDEEIIQKQSKNTAIIFRNYTKQSNEEDIVRIKNYCKKLKLKFFLSNNLKYALKLGLDGAYIPSFNRDMRHLSYNLPVNFLIIGSAHNLKEIREKEIQKVKLVFISSIFKKNKNYLGLNKFKLISKLTSRKIIALGGITRKNKKKLSLINSYGFAGISYFE